MVAVHRIALISDIHGNAIALSRVLASIANVGVDQIVCLGDVATLGVAPREVLDMLRDAHCPCIAGNHDDYVLSGALDDGHAPTPELRDAIQWCRELMTPADMAFVSAFDAGLLLPLGAHHRLQLFHGSPTSNLVNLLPDTPGDALDSLLGEPSGVVLAGGHTHIQMLRQHRGVLLVNPGSVGAPFSEYPISGPPRILAQAEYAIIEARGPDIHVSLQRLALDRRELFQAAITSQNPMAARLAEAYY